MMAVALAYAPAACGADEPSGVAVGGAHVTTSWELVDDGAQLHVVITPDAPAFHLYSTDLVPADHRGLGVATELAVEGGWRSTAGPRATVEVVDVVIDALGVRLPAFPNGPVEFVLPVKLESDAPVELVVTFGLCSASTCLKPARDVHIAVESPPLPAP